MHRRLPSLILLASLVLLAGCATAPTDTTTTPAGTETFEVRMTGDAGATYVVSADLLADPDATVTLTYANNSTRSVSMPDQQGAVTYGPASDVTAVEPVGEVAGGVYFEGSPNFTVTDDEVPPTGNVVYSVRKMDAGSENETALAAWGLIRCDGHVAGLSLRVNESGVEGVGFECAS